MTNTNIKKNISHEIEIDCNELTKLIHKDQLFEEHYGSAFLYCLYGVSQGRIRSDRFIHSLKQALLFYSINTDLSWKCLSIKWKTNEDGSVYDNRYPEDTLVNLLFKDVDEFLFLMDTYEKEIEYTAIYEEYDESYDDEEVEEIQEDIKEKFLLTLKDKHVFYGTVSFAFGINSQTDDRLEYNALKSFKETFPKHKKKLMLHDPTKETGREWHSYIKRHYEGIKVSREFLANLLGDDIETKLLISEVLLTNKLTESSSDVMIL